MIVRKRTKGGKSLNMKVKDPIRFVARETNGRSATLGFTLDYYETNFNLTLSERELFGLYEELKGMFEVPSEEK